MKVIYYYGVIASIGSHPALFNLEYHNVQMEAYKEAKWPELYCFKVIS